LILLFVTATESRIFVVPIEPTPPEIDIEEDNFPSYLTIYEKIQLSLIEYNLIVMYGNTYFEENYKF
jgi:hypothetical protein